MGDPVDDTPTFIATPKGDELVIMTRAHYDRLVGWRTPVARTMPPSGRDASMERPAISGGPVAMFATSPDVFTLEDDADAEMARVGRAEWVAAGKPSAPLAVIRRVRAGDSWLKAFRAYRNMTQTDLARRAGIGQGYLSEIETNRKTPSTDARDALARALEIHPLFLSEDAPAVAVPGIAS